MRQKCNSVACSTTHGRVVEETRSVGKPRALILALCVAGLLLCIGSCLGRRCWFRLHDAFIKVNGKVESGATVFISPTAREILITLPRDFSTNDYLLVLFRGRIEVPTENFVRFGFFAFAPAVVQTDEYSSEDPMIDKDSGITSINGGIRFRTLEGDPLDVIFPADVMRRVPES